jgi:hypothetical protein
MCVPPGTQADKAHVFLREEAIRCQMEDARRAGEFLPRWKAAQTPLANLSEVQRIRLKSEEHARAYRNLHRRLHDLSKEVGQAFHELCEAGCKAESLEATLQGLRIFPVQLGRTKKLLNCKTRGCVSGAAANLDSAARKLERSQSLILSLWNKSGDWPVPAHELVKVVRGIAMCLRKGLEKPNEAFHATARDHVPFVIDEIVRETGRPHYKQMAVLIGAAYGGRYPEADLKMLVSRHRRRP